jgi:hypothetical protein
MVIGEEIFVGIRNGAIYRKTHKSILKKKKGMKMSGTSLFDNATFCCLLPYRIVQIFLLDHDT